MFEQKSVRIGTVMIVVGIVMLLRSAGIFENVDREILWALGLVVAGSVMVMSKQQK